MNQNLHKRILFPFIIFTIVLTVFVIAWSSFLMFGYFKQTEMKLLQDRLISVEQLILNLDYSNRFIHSIKKSKSETQSFLTNLEQTQAVIDVYDYKTLTKDVYFSLTEDVFMQHTGDDLSVMYKSQHVRRPFLTQFSLSKLLTFFENKDYIVGIFYSSEQSSFTNFYSSNRLSDKEKNDFYELYRHFLNSKENAQSDSLTLLSTFSESEVFPNTVFFIASKTFLFQQIILKIILGMIFAILLSTTGIFIIYSIIIKKMKTSIDVLSSVSKKVANGNFTERVFIYSDDEIGELSKSFNKMISKLKQSTETIIQQKDQSDAIITCIPDGIIVTNFENKLIIANKRAEDMFGFQFKKNYLAPIDDCIDHASFKQHSKHLKTSSTFMSEFMFKSKPVEQILTMTSTVLYNIDEIPQGIVYLIRDVTHEKQIEQLREGFLRTVSHELRTPLTSVIGFIELVSHSGEETLTDEQKSCLKTALTEARSLKVLINDLLELSQMQSEQQSLHFSTFNLFDFVQDITTTLYPLAKGKNLQLVNAVQRKSLEITADETKLRRVFINLISNGIKFTHVGEIKVSCVELDDCIEFCVSDTGIGLKPNEKDVIFEKFRQIDYSSKRQYQGIGLGLSIVKELVELHKGSVRVESVVDKGSNFYFTIEKKRDLTAAVKS